MTNTNNILKEFLEKHTELAKSSAEFDIHEIKESTLIELGKQITQYFEPPKIEISVYHPFIFDLRLIPKEFMGHSVRRIMTESYPEIFEENGENFIPLDVHFAPERYTTFVNQNIDQIRKELGNDTLTHEEALDALTGGFQKHIQCCEEVRRNIETSSN